MTAPATEGPRLSRLMLLPYPFAAAAVAINFFMFGLMGQWIGLPAIPPLVALALSLPLGVPASWGFSLWMKGVPASAQPDWLSQKYLLSFKPDFCSGYIVCSNTQKELPLLY